MYEIYALRYARVDRRPGDVFLSGDPHDAPGEMDYFVWAIRGADGRTILLDTGFSAAEAARRQRTLLCPVDVALARLGVDCASIRDVIISHMHYDHAGNLGLFPNARFHIQDREMSFATGRCMGHARLNHPYAVEDVCDMVRRVYDGRVVFHDGDGELAPGLTVHRVGGHSHGLMAVRVETRRGAVVLASDATHYYANIERREPFPILYNMGDVLDGYARLFALGRSIEFIIPGHDPKVRQLYPQMGDLDIYALHEPPRHVAGGPGPASG
jgi:glyoxylase-like metal-dependent hydrolase (beta-lactamase superfamily II)